MENSSFHLSLPCYDIKETKKFYVETLGFKAGRSASDTWIDIDMAGNQLTFLKALRWRFPDKYYQFEGHVLPAFHFGVLLDKAVWAAMHVKCLNQGLCNEDTMKFLEGKSGEHRSFFIEDPNDYVIEFKCFTDSASAFQR